MKMKRVSVRARRRLVCDLLSMALFLTLAFSGAVEPCAAQLPGAIEEQDEIVVTASRAAAPLDKVSANLMVITREQLENLPVSNLGQALQYFPGLYIESWNGQGGFSMASIQGAAVRHTAVYQDGVPLNQLDNPLTDLSMISVETVERVEIYKGAASSAWGSALGGVINIITRSPDPKKAFCADLKTSYGEYETFKARGTVSGAKAGLGVLASYSRDESDGFMKHTDYNRESAYAKLDYSFNPSNRIDFAFSRMTHDLSDPVTNYPEFWDDADQKRTYQRLLFETSPADDMLISLEGRHSEYDIKVEDVYPDFRAVFNDYEDEIWGIGARFAWEAEGWNTLSAGFDQDWGDYDWFAYDRDYDTRNTAFYANDSYSWNNLTVNAGIRHDDNRDFGGETSPSIGLVYRFPAWDSLIRVQAAKGFSAPPASWVHDPTYGNPDLDPETAVNYQCGASFPLFDFLRFEIGAFRADVDDLIVFDHDTWRFQNIEEVTRKGFEGKVTATFDWGLSASFAATYTDVVDDRTDEKVEDIPRTILHLSVLYANSWTSHSIAGKYIDHNSSFEETRDQRFVFDYLAKFKIPTDERYGKLSLFGAVYNVTDCDYVYRDVFPQPDRWAEAGVVYEY